MNIKNNLLILAGVRLEILFDDGSGGTTPAATGSAGSGDAHNNTQPTLVANTIIKT